MFKRSRKGGLLGILFGGVLIVGIAAVIIAVLVVRNVRVEHRATERGDSVQIQTPLGALRVNPRDSLNPETIGVPIYPGAERTKEKNGGVKFDFDSENGTSRNFAVSAASYATHDSAEQVHEFYRTHLPNWSVSEKNGRDLEFHFSEGGYKRIVAINERHGETRIGIVSFGEPGVN